MVVVISGFQEGDWLVSIMAWSKGLIGTREHFMGNHECGFDISSCSIIRLRIVTNCPSPESLLIKQCVYGKTVIHPRKEKTPHQRKTFDYDYHPRVFSQTLSCVTSSNDSNALTVLRQSAEENIGSPWNPRAESHTRAWYSPESFLSVRIVQLSRLR